MHGGRLAGVAMENMLRLPLLSLGDIENHS
jgi:hypothetical protein